MPNLLLLGTIVGALLPLHTPQALVHPASCRRMDAAAIDSTQVEWSVGDVVPNVGFTDLNGKHHTLSEFRGKYVLIELWGTWCSPCRAELPSLKEAYRKYQAHGFEIVGLDYEDIGVQVPDSIRVKVYQEIKDRARAFLAAEVTWPQVSTIDPARPGESVQNLMTRIKIHDFPSSVLLDPTGRVVSTGKKGQLPLHGSSLLETLHSVLPLSDAPYTSTPAGTLRQPGTPR